MIISSFARYEKKYLLTEEQYKGVISVIREHMRPDEYCIGGKDYQLANIYYDTPESNLIRYSLSSPKFKEKLRLRCYDTPKDGSSRVFVEIKRKINGLVVKRRAKLTLDETTDFLEMGKIPDGLAYIDRQVLGEIDYFMSLYDVKPMVYIGYEREAYFLPDDKDFRVTFDRNILTRRSDLFLEDGRHGEPLLKPGQCLMEVKVLREFPVWLARTFSENGVVGCSFSKYGTEYKQHILLQKNIITA